MCQLSHVCFFCDKILAMNRKTYRIIYEDQWIFVCYKPSGMPVQTAKIGVEDMVSCLKTYRVRKQEEPFIGVITRLDQPVEGLLVFAKTKKAAANLSGQQQTGDWAKDYKAVVCGAMPGKVGRLEDYLCRDGRQNLSKVVKKGEKDAKLAVLNYEVKETRNGYSLLEIHLETGRHHQIRTQLSHAGYPIYGDVKYGTGSSIGLPPLALCEYHLRFLHPKTGEKIEYHIQPEGEGFNAFQDKI